MKAEKFELRYCIEHEKVVPVWASTDAITHTGPDAGDFFAYAYDCEGPFTFSAPPELEEDWELNLDAPSSDELAEMDVMADELLWQAFELQ